MQLDYYFDSTITETEFEEEVMKYLAEGDYTPDDIFESITTEKNLCGVPFFYYLKDYKGNAFAEGGQERTETYVVNNNTQYRTRTDWFPISQYIEGEVDAVVYAGTPCHKSIVDFYEKLKFKIADLKEVKVIDAYFDGLSKLFEKSSDEQWEKHGVYYAYEKVKSISIHKIRAKLVRNFDVQVRFSDKESFSFIYPFWVFNYSYNNEQFVYILDGLNKERFAGSRPVDKKKKVVVSNYIKGIWILGILFSLFASGIAFLFTKEILWVPLSLFVSGIGITVFLHSGGVKEIKNQSKLARQRKLREIQSDRSTTA
jgi:hypothetical protein